MATTTRRPPGWFWPVAIALFLWEIMGVWSLYEHVRFGPEGMGEVPTDYDRRLFAALPGWYSAVFAVATLGGLAGAIALLLRSRLAVPSAALSLLAVVVMFGWFFLATDIIAVKGVWTTYFPAAIFLIGVFSLWFALTARRRGWIG